MQKSISSRCVAAVALLLLCLFSLSQADEIDDEALKSAFEKKLRQLHDAGKTISQSQVHRELIQMEGKTFPLSARDKKARPSTNSLYSRACDATLAIGHLYLCEKCDRWHASLATGIVVTAEGLILTNYHVLNFERAKAYGAMTSDGRVFPLKSVVATSQRDDLALIRLGGSPDLSFVSLASEATVGEPIAVVSHPDSHFFTYSKGHISRHFLTPKTKVPRLQITAPFAKGSSGAGVLNESGELVGLVAATNSIYYRQEDKRQEDLQTVIYSCVPLSAIRKLLVTSPPLPSPTSQRE